MRYGWRMVVLNRIYTRTGDKGETALGSGERVSKAHLRIHAYGTVDETNAVIGLARLHTPAISPISTRCWRASRTTCSTSAPISACPIPARIWDMSRCGSRATQGERLEAEIDALNAELSPLRSFVLPGGHPAAAHLHVARTVCRRAERLIVDLDGMPGETVSAGGDRLSSTGCRTSSSSPAAGSTRKARATCSGFRGRTAECSCRSMTTRRCSVIRFQYVTGGIIVVNIVLFLLTGAFANDQSLWAVAAGYGVVPADLTNILPPVIGFNAIPEPLTLLTYQFLHGGWLHLISNMLFLWVFADNIEDAFGHFGFALFYLLCGIAGGLMHTMLQTHFAGAADRRVGRGFGRARRLSAALSRAPMCGSCCSCACRCGSRPFWALGGWFVLQIVVIFMTSQDDVDVAWGAHIGGFLAGLVLTIVLRSRLLMKPSR